MSGTTWSKFYWSDWESDPALRACTMAAQGFWMRMLCIAAKHEPIGYVAVNGRTPQPEEFARMCGCSPAEAEAWLTELERNGVFSRDRHGRIYSRRLIRDAHRAKTAQKNGKKGGNPNLGKQREISGLVNPPLNGGDNTHKPIANNQYNSTLFDTEPIPAASQGDDEFEAWYRTYPRHEGRGQALKAYRTARKKASAEVLLAAAQAAARAYADREKRFIPLPATWLNGERWLDEGVSGSAAKPAQNPEDLQWQSRLDGLKRFGNWLRDWGPKPGEPGCMVPAHLLKGQPA